MRPYVEATLKLLDEVRPPIELQEGVDSRLDTSVLGLPDVTLVRGLLRKGRDHRLEHLEVRLPIVDFHFFKVVTEEGFDLLSAVLRVQKLLSHRRAVLNSHLLALFLGLLPHFREEREQAASLFIWTHCWFGLGARGGA